MVRVAVVADGRGWGGAQVYARSLVQHAPAGVECTVVTTAGHAPRLPGPQRVISTTVTGETSSLAAALQDLRPDLVQVNLVDPSSMVAALEVAAGCAPTAATLHLSGGVVDRARTRAAYARLTRLVAVSRPIAAFARDHLGVAAPVHVLNGVDPQPPLAPPAGRVPVIGALGRLTPQKGFDVLLDALALLHSRGEPVRLVLGGEGRAEDALRRQAAGLPVEWLGFCEGPRDVLERCDVFCLPSRDEALPLVLLEAVSAGLPAVASDVGDVREALGDVVLVVPPEDPVALADALARLTRDPGERQRRGALGAQRVRERLNAQRMADQTWRALLERR